MKFPVLIASLLLCLPCCLAGGACPSKMELKTCTCRHLKLKNSPALPPLRRRRDIPSGIKRSLSDTSHSNHLTETTDTSTSLSMDSNRPPTNPTMSNFRNDESSHSEGFNPVSTEEPTHPTLSSDDFSHSDNGESTHQKVNGNDFSPTGSTENTLSSDTTDLEVQGRRMGTDDDEFEEDIQHPRGDRRQLPPVSGLGFLSRSFGAYSGKKHPQHEKEPPQGAFQLTIVDCREPRTITEFEEILLFALHRRSVDKLIVSHLPPAKEESLARLPARGMRNTRIKQFEIRDTPLSGDFIWYGNPFEGQANSLLRFAANRCYLFGALTYEDPGTINTKGLHLLPHIEAIDLSTNHLTIIKSTAFKFPPANLTSVGLSKNSLQTLEPGCFQNISHLRMVDLSHNLLKTVARTIFAAPARFLESINLSDNFLDMLPVDFFVNMPSLRIVNFSKNFLHTVPEKPWITSWRQLMVIDVTGNFLYCDCHLLWLLSILSPSKPNATSTPSPISLPGQLIKGSCTYNRMPNYLPIQYSLATLTRDMLMC